MKLTLEVFGSIMILFSFLPLFKTTLWFIRVLDFPRPQIAFFLAVVLVSYLYFYQPVSLPEIIFVGLLALGLLNEIKHFYKFTVFWPVEALNSKIETPENSLSIMISNVRMSNKHYDRFIKVVKETDPDILLVNEPDEKWAAHLAVLEPDFPYCIKCPLNNTYGMMFFSKFKLIKQEIRFLVEEGIPSFYSVVELPSGKIFDFFTVHPQPPHLNKNTDTREAELLIVAKLAKESAYASVVAGDLNDVAWSHTTNLFRKISSLLDPRIGRGFYNTYNALVPFFRYSLDHIFYDKAFRLIEMKRLSKFGSDHFPILVRLNYEPQEANEHEVPVADQEDKKEAEELIENVKEDQNVKNKLQ